MTGVQTCALPIYLYLLPRRRALGLNPATGVAEAPREQTVAAFVCPAYTLSATAAYVAEEGAPKLPLFAYGAVGFADGRFWVAATRVDKDRRQVLLMFRRNALNAVRTIC